MKKEKRTVKVTEKKLADGVIKLDCEATAIEVNNALKEAAEAFAMQMGVRPAPGKSIEELAKEQLGIADLDKIVEPNAIEVLVPRALDRRNLVPAFPPKATPTVKFERGKKFTFTLNVTVKPTYELASYEPVEITVPPFAFDETPINQQLEEIAKNSVTYVVADAKPLAAGDACSIAMKCFDDGEEIKALTCDDRTYLMGRGYMPEGFDEALIGMEPGQTKEFTFEAPLGTENGEVVNKPISCDGDREGDSAGGRAGHRRRLGEGEHAHVREQGGSGGRYAPRFRGPAARGLRGATCSRWPSASSRGASRAASPTRSTRPRATSSCRTCAWSFSRPA